ncbi:MAG: hypothetical protein KF862_14340 [Chitinophagaceae bacterium]|nr:hypothetical protein [Chitinophagaceae bacterium]
MRKYFSFSILLFCFITSCSTKSSLNDFLYKEGAGAVGVVSHYFRFNGFTEYWQDVNEQRIRYGNLFRMNIPDQQAAVLQAKVNLAEALDMPGFRMQEGFLNELLAQPYTMLENAPAQEIEAALQTGKNVLLLTTGDNEVAKKLESKYKDPAIAGDLNSHQANAQGFSVTNAFMLSNKRNTLFVVSASDPKYLGRFKTIWTGLEKILGEYDLKRGWFGAQTLIKSVTCTPGTPIEVIGRGMNEGNSWFVFDGYMEFLAKNEIEGWVKEVNLPVVADVGFSPMYGLEDYDGLQVQSMFTPESWIAYAKSKKGYVFHPVFDTAAERLKLDYDGYFAAEGNMEQINEDGKPFVAATGALRNGATTSMVVFTKKNEPFTNAKLWEAIMDQREVAILAEGKMMGPALYRNALQLLLLDRVFLEEYFGDRINLETVTESNKVHLTVSNLYPYAVEGNIHIKLPPQLSLPGDSVIALNLPANSSKDIVLDIQPSPGAMGKPNAVAIQYNWGDRSKSTVAAVELPPAISVHELLYGHSSGIKYPLSVYNYTKQASFPVKIRVTDKADSNKIVFEKEEIFNVDQGTFATKELDIKIPAGSYTVYADAPGVRQTTQLGVEGAAGTASLKEVDLNNDGISEYNMENDAVKVTLLTTGARVIEYIVKSKNDNILFKLWPEKPIDDRRPFRTREFYPYGGFEDFLGQPSIETHKVYDAEVVKKEGEYVQVKMKAEYYGNIIEKIFTLYGNSPLLEIRFALTMRNPEMNMLGPQPILEIGKMHGPEDKFMIPEMDGVHEYRMRMDRYFGRAFFVKEGWNAGQDTKEDIGFVGAFPVKQPIFLHMWMNHPSNPGSHYYYAEFQPWTPLFQNTTTYFSYYMWVNGGSWEKSLQALRDRNLITEK